MGIFKGVGKKVADGAIEKFAQSLATIDFDKFNLVSKYLTEEQANEFHKNLALIIAYGVQIGAKKLAEKAN